MGYVYILTNPSFREDWIKIGKTKNPVDVRSKDLDNTAVPLPFEIYATIKTEKYNELEATIHKTLTRLTDTRIRKNREFYNMKPEEALAQIKDLCKLIDDAVIDSPDNDADESSEGKSKRKITYLGEYRVNSDEAFFLVPYSDLYEGIMVINHKEDGDEYVLKEGSRIDPNLYTNVNNIKRIRDRHKDCLSGNVVIKDIVFKSPSGPADFVRGRAINGKMYWQTKDGTSIHDFIEYIKK